MTPTGSGHRPGRARSHAPNLLVGGPAGAAGVFERAAPIYGRVGPALFSHYGRRLVELAGLQPRGRVLDVAAGAGAVLLPAAERVGPDGHVVGVDLAAAMAARLRQELAAHGVGNAAVCRMDAQALGFAGGCFDAVLCGFALDVVPRPQRALAEFHRVLGRGGRLGLTLAPGWWWEGDDRWRWHGELLGQVGATTQGWDGTAEDLVTGVEAAGFVGVAVVEELFPLVFADARQWWRWAWSHGFRGVLEAMDPATLERYRVASFAQLGALWGCGAIHGRLKVLLVLASKDQDRRPGW